MITSRNKISEKDANTESGLQ